jgi:hypothetical protein
MRVPEIVQFAAVVLAVVLLIPAWRARRRRGSTPPPTAGRPSVATGRPGPSSSDPERVEVVRMFGTVPAAPVASEFSGPTTLADREATVSAILERLQDDGLSRTDHEMLAWILARLSESLIGGFERLSPDDQQRWIDRRYLDSLVASGQVPEEDWLRTLVLVRRMGTGLDETGGLALMVMVAERAQQVSTQRILRDIEHRWDGIGRWGA